MTETDELFKERYALAYGRLKEIIYEKTAPEPYLSFFSKEASFLARLFEKYEELYKENGCGKADSGGTQDKIEQFYDEITPEAYESSFGNPVYAARIFGEVYGKLFCWLYAEMTGAASFAFADRPEELIVAAELFLEIYSGFIYEEIITEEQFLSIIYSYNYDYCPEFTKQYIDGLACADGCLEVPGSLPARSIDLCMPLAGIYEDGGKYEKYLDDHRYDCGLYLDERLVTARLQAVRNTLKDVRYCTLMEKLAVRSQRGRSEKAMMENADAHMSGKSKKLLKKYISGSFQIIGRFVNGGEL